MAALRLTLFSIQEKKESSVFLLIEYLLGNGGKVYWVFEKTRGKFSRYFMYLSCLEILLLLTPSKSRIRSF